MNPFNLIDEKWIPIRFPDGRRCELGIRDTLLQCGEIAAIEDPSPLVVAALHRFLLAVLYRALEGPTDIDRARDLFRNGLPAERTSAYLERWRDRFALFDRKYPFGQIPEFTPKTWRAWTALAVEHNADNAKVLFDHVAVEEPGTISAAEAARWMLATQTFSVSCGKSELSHTGTAPSATGVMVLPLGRDLRDTLLFSLVPQNREMIPDDLPLWERVPESVKDLKEGVKRAICGFADRYTWRARSIRLDADQSGRVERLAFASGVGSASDEQIDPMFGYRIDKKNGRFPIQFRDRGLWRDFDSLLPDGSDLAPRVIEHAIQLTRSDRARFPGTVMVLGQSNDQAKIEFWRMERFALPGALANNPHVRSEIRGLLADAERARGSLRKACGSFARDLLSRGEREPRQDDITKFIETMTAEARYWSILESRFHEVLREYSFDRDFDDVRRGWLGSVSVALREAWAEHSAAASAGDAWAIRALVKAEKHVFRKLKELRGEMEDLGPHPPEEETV